MQARLSAVQQALIALTVVTLAVAALVRPAPENAGYRRALAELTSIEKRFDRERVEQSLEQIARAEARQPLHALAREVDSLRPVELRLSRETLAVDPLVVHVQLNRLADLDRFAQPDAQLSAAVADISGLGHALAWRLARTQDSGPATLRSAQLQAAQVAPADIRRERRVFELQDAQSEAAAAVDEASAQLERIERLYEARVKRHVSNKLRAETYKARREARRAMRDAQRTLRVADEQYAAAADAALRFEPRRQSGSSPESGVIRVELARADGPVVYKIPVPVEARMLRSPPLQGVSFRETRAAGVWDDVQGLNVAAARTLVQRHFNWHYRHVELGGVRLGGMTVLQLAPCMLPLLLLLLLARMRAVLLTYNPFRTRVRSALLRVGYRTRALDALAVVALPLMAAVLATSSLIIVGQMPALPLIAAVTSLLLGGFAFVKLGELQRLAEDVVRSQSLPPTPQHE